MGPILPADKAAEAAGVDEAGRGCLAGPVVAAAVILPPYAKLPGLTDSKKLRPEARDRLEALIKSRAAAWCVGVSWPGEIERYNILGATFRAMARAVRFLKVPPRELYVDGNHIIPGGMVGFVHQTPVVDGDLKVRCISAASIIAKTFRDRLMTKLDKRYPGYGFALHKGYGTAMHLGALRTLGPCRMHRRTFAGVLDPDAGRGPESLCLPGI